MKLTIIVRREESLFHRTVQVELTPEQAAQLVLADDEAVQVVTVEGEPHEWRPRV